MPGIQQQVVNSSSCIYVTQVECISLRGLVKQAYFVYLLSGVRWNWGRGATMEPHVCPWFSQNHAPRPQGFRILVEGPFSGEIRPWFQASPFRAKVGI